MTRIAKLYTRAAANPAGLSFREFERLLAAFGFVHDRTTGSPRQYVRQNVPAVFTVLPTGKSAPTYQVRQFLAMIDQYGLTMDD